MQYHLLPAFLAHLLFILLALTLAVPLLVGAHSGVGVVDSCVMRAQASSCARRSMATVGIFRLSPPLFPQTVSNHVYGDTAGKNIVAQTQKID